MLNILYALLIVAGIGVLAGVLLAVASHCFAVKVDEKVVAVRACLPGANCGACGYAGCDAYAEAVAAGKAQPDKCIPGGPNTAAKLSEVLGVEIEVSEPRVAYVNCSGDCDAVGCTVVYDGIKGCKAANMLYGGPELCKYGCVGCGDCVKSCPVGAITVEKELARVDPLKCIACGACVKSCPKGIISLVEENVAVAVACSNKEKGAVARKHCMNACIGCKKCEKVCESDAVKVVDNLAVIDYSKCTHCRKCAEACPTGRLKVVDMAHGVI